ncbi:leucine-rich repeat domain-containing protein [Mediterraneibacter gnavus]|uniref:Cell wall surface anchor family protein n=1 Tax=Mediterraneibacter gnavus (strain ATCC 29149 / DSM 114966 / JCM 6515 / VPI C7-9) TaxID=411470 RepID=A7B6A7_MEDG7|nr:leucine-rich repeat domain-containing protein [Mediterraneibacter gnavus]EDN76659.1 cell wall surface anchor family protein [Mediterraneibacter gnavus ATCC 29149]PQL32235.1 leucine-rich repeat domain-containing protein [Mediterraneibacter gnavus ATCC 29149]QEI31356.1 leucine-rich repeat domain-containing protein [Mediterraneibacter gnavus ATCC 29149]QHB23851.1 leucine-rich repeat domain-containing protein [Mediterraneibacter gnavus ATCC 29149]UZT22457.1 leucine-rich repeat domain-containing
MKIKKLTAYLLMSGMILGTMSSDLYTIKAQAVETIEETEDKTPENETPQIPETPEQPETEPENEEVTEAAPVGEIELSAEQFPDQVILTFAGTCDKDGNGSLSEAECMEVEELAMPNAGITDLKGVENFRNLQRVDVSQNAIGDFAPVKDLSSLQILKVNGNPASVLDVTGCSSLKKLYAQNSTFSELHVTGLGSLEEVRIENNHLTDLDLTGLTSLRALSCYGNQLHTLDARPAAALEVLQADSNGMESLLVEGLGNLKTLHCQNNNLQQISLSGLGALEEFNAANNSLRELIVDEATALKTVLAGNNQLSGEFRFGTAKQVSVENNQITNLIGVEENIAYLNFNNNQLTSLKMDSAAPESVYGNGNNLSLLQFGDVSNLKTLYCAENHLAWTESGKALDLQLSPQTIELKRKYDGEKYWTDLNEVLTPQQLQRTEVLMGENSQIASFDKESGKVFYTGPASALEYYFTAGDVGEDEGNARMLVQAKLTEETHVPGAQEILNDILANNKIPSEVKAGTERLVLPEVPEGSKIEIVAVNPEGIIGLDGKVTTPENDTDVIVTIQVTDTNEATAKADVKVLVRGEKADPDDDNNGNDNNGGNDNNSGNNNNGGSNNGGNNNTGNNGGSSNGGSHNNGSTSGSHSQSVQTGDNANVIMWAVLLVAAVAAVGAVVIIRRKKK